MPGVSEDTVGQQGGGRAGAGPKDSWAWPAAACGLATQVSETSGLALPVRLHYPTRVKSSGGAVRITRPWSAND